MSNVPTQVFVVPWTDGSFRYRIGEGPLSEERFYNEASARFAGRLALQITNNLERDFEAS
jgi:hypothetical protein